MHDNDSGTEESDPGPFSLRCKMSKNKERDMNSMIDKQAIIDKEIANALIIATPEHWNSAEMLVERAQEGKHEKMNISISSPEGHRNLIEPTEDIYINLYKLSDLFRENGKTWHRAIYTITVQTDGNWKYTVNFHY